MIEKIGDVELTDEYWDCDCEHFFIHPAKYACCEICSAVKEECPNSRVDEVLAGGYPVSRPTPHALDSALPEGHSGSSLTCPHPFCVAERNPPSQ